MNGALAEGPKLSEGAICCIVSHADPAVYLALLFPLQADGEGNTDSMAKSLSCRIIKLSKKIYTDGF